MKKPSEVFRHLREFEGLDAIVEVAEQHEEQAEARIAELEEQVDQLLACSDDLTLRDIIIKRVSAWLESKPEHRCNIETMALGCQVEHEASEHNHVAELERQLKEAQKAVLTCGDVDALIDAAWPGYNSQPALDAAMEVAKERGLLGERHGTWVPFEVGDVIRMKGGTVENIVRRILFDVENPTGVHVLGEYTGYEIVTDESVLPTCSPDCGACVRDEEFEEGPWTYHYTDAEGEESVLPLAEGKFCPDCGYKLEVSGGNGGK